MKALIHIVFSFLLAQVLLFPAFAQRTSASSPTLDQLVGNQAGKQGQVLTSDGVRTQLQPLPAQLPIAPTISPNLTVSTKTGAYTIATGDAQNTLLVFNNASATTLTIPADGVGNSGPGVSRIPVGSLIRGLALTEFDVLISPAAGVTLITPSNGGDRTDGAGASFTLIKTAANTWSLSGDVYSQTYTMFPGQSLSLAVKVSAGLGASPRTFQWNKNGTAIPGATATAFTIPTVTSDDAGTYTVRVTNSGGSIISGTYILVVATP